LIYPVYLLFHISKSDSPCFYQYRFCLQLKCLLLILLWKNL
jgi:hypothetical protein